MKSIKSVVAAAVFFMATLFISSTAFAQADGNGLIVRGELGVPIIFNAGFGDDSAMINGDGAGIGAYTSVGVNLELQIGYKAGGWGILLYQDIGGSFVTDKDVKDIWDELHHESPSFFFGGTFLMFEEYVSFGKEALLSFAEGLGAFYGAKMDFRAFQGVESDAAFALRANIGFDYFIMGTYGVGFQLDYSLAFAIDDGVTFSHIIIPSLAFTYILD